MIKKWLLCFVLSFLMFMFIGITPSSAAENQLIIINKSNNQLAFYENGQLLKVHSVATGKIPSYTPEGNFKIVNKIVNRPYYSGNIPGGDPRNPLGNRWLGINARGTWGTTYAIHGNNNVSSIGKYVSAGCIRMYNDEIEWLYSKVKVNTPVIITSTSKSFVSIATSNGFNVSNSTAPVNGNNSQILKKGSSGSAVKELQRQLTDLGYNTKGIDGIFGFNTEKAVRQFQKDHHLAADGVVGPATNKALSKL